MPATKAKGNPRSSSTTWTWQRDRIRKDPAPQAAQGAKRRRWSHLGRRNAADRLTITIKYRGGNECWYHVEARGSNGAFPGVMALHDVMREINEGKLKWVDET